jgi:hypothetical protein
MIAVNDRISNRISFAVVLASLVIGSALIVLSGIPSKWYGIPVIGLADFVYGKWQIRLHDQKMEKADLRLLEWQFS